MGSIQFGGLSFIAGHTHGVIDVETDVDAGPQEPGDQRDVVVGVRRGRPVVHQRVGFAAR